MINVLYLADPNSIHDTKWINTLASFGVRPFWLVRKSHLSTMNLLNHNDTVSYIEDFSILRFPITLYTAFRIKMLIKRHQIDVLHIMYAEPNSLWVNFKNLFRIPVIITTRGTDVLKTIPEAFKNRNIINSIVAPLYRRAFLKADFITSTSEGQIKSIQQFSGVTNNISIVRTGVDLQKICSSTEKFFPLRDSKPFILFPRYIKPIYNHEFCLDAIEFVSSTNKKKYKMVFLGKDSGDLAYQEMLTSRMRSMKGVEFEFINKQSQEALFELYKRAEIVIMTPKSDGSPVSAMEAIACCTPVILGPIGYDEILFKEKTITLTSWNPEELGVVIDKVLIGRLKENYIISKEFLDFISLERNMRMVETIYRSLLDDINK